MLSRIKKLTEDINIELDSVNDFTSPCNAHQLLVDALEFLNILAKKESEITFDDIVEEKLNREKNPVDA